MAPYDHQHHQHHQQQPENKIVNSMQHDQQNEHQPRSAQGVAHWGQGGIRSKTMTFNSCRRQMNDVNLNRLRRINFNHVTRKHLDMTCEEKVSKYKLEEIHCSLPSSVKSTFIMTFSPDGQRVASTHGDHRIYICDLITGKLLSTLEGHPKTPWCLTWHPTNREIIASGCLAGEVRVWDLKSKACESWTSANGTIITSLDFHPRERVLVIATANDILFWDWSESEPFAKTTTIHDKEKVKFVVFDSSGTKLITGISNSPRFAGYSSDSLQNRIVDSYVLSGSYNQLQPENMAQTSEIITSPVSASSSGNVNENDAHTSSHDRQYNTSTNIVSGNDTDRVNLQTSNVNNQDHDLEHRNTITLSRVACLYRQLEALEDSMRNTSFTPYISPRTIIATSESDESSNNNSDQNNSEQPTRGEVEQSGESSPTPTDTSGDQPGIAPVEQNSSQSTTSDSNEINQAGSTLNTFESHIVAFDESLEQLQLPPLIVDGQAVNMATLIERYPIDISHQFHYVMQFDSINQVNQNFIRISKLMSSVRLYRQLVQQIMSSNSGTGHHQSNQILTAQSVSARSSRNSANLPLVLRNFSIGDFIEPGGLVRASRSTDPIMALQFRNTARNVPLVTICKIDLLAARASCISRSQMIVEQALAGLQTSLRNHMQQTTSVNSSSSSSSSSNDRSRQASQQETTQLQDASTLHPILNQLHTSLITINHAPLTTSNVYSHINSLRVIVENLLQTLSLLLNSSADGRRLIDLINNTAFSLTGRRWGLPLGPTYDQIRLDVVHTLCVVDLSLHFVRQIQLLQMHRISIMARIEESRRFTSSSLVQETVRPSTDILAPPPPTSSHLDSTGDATGSTPMLSASSSSPQPGSSAGPNPSVAKRKDADSQCEPNKRRRLDQNNSESMSVESNNSMMDASPPNQGPATNNQASHLQQPGGPPINHLLESPIPDRLLLWNNGHLEQSLQRFLLASAITMTNHHILVRINHRLHGIAHPMPMQASSIIDHSFDQSAAAASSQFESRRRASSQDSSINQQQESAEAAAHTTAAAASAGGGIPRNRVRPPALHVNFVPTGSAGGYSAPGGMPFEQQAWQRQPHLHVYQTRGPGQHLWFNQLFIPLPVNNSNYRLQCWNFSLTAIPNIKDSQCNVITQKCRIHNDSSIDLSSDGSLIACLVPRDDVATYIPSFDLKIFSLKSSDFGVCYYKLPHGPNAVSVSLSPSANYAVVGLASHKFISNDPSDDNLTIGKVFKLNGDNSFGFVRDIKIKRDDSSLSLNAIRWLPRGIVYNVGPQHHQRYQAARMRNVVAS